MTGRPARAIGPVDRRFHAPGMMADDVVFDSATVIDHATHAQPTDRSDGIRHVLVNGTIAHRDVTQTVSATGRFEAAAGPV